MHPAVLALIISNIIWGAAIPIFKFSLENIPPFTLLFIRFFIAGLIFLPGAIITWKKLTGHEWIRLIACAVLGYSIAISLLFVGLETAPSINFPIIASAGPIVLYFIAITILKEKPHKKVLFGSLISLAGVMLIVISPLIFDGVATDIGEVHGNMLFVLATISSVIYTVVARPLMKSHSVYQVTATMFLVAALTYIPFMNEELQSWSFSQLDYHGVLGIIYGIFFSSAIAYWLYHYGIARVKAQEIGVFTYIDPIVALLIAIPLLNERPTPVYILGSVLVFIGIFVAEKRVHYHPINKLRRR